MKNKSVIPFGLTTLRLALGPVALYCACASLSRIWFLVIMITALLSDIFDGVLAGRFNVSTPRLRRYDSLTDIIFYSFILVSTAVVAPALVRTNCIYIALALAAEAACILIALLKFRRVAAAHSFLAKFFGLMLFVGLTVVLCTGGRGWVFPALSISCTVVDMEIILMMLLASQPPVDVFSVLPQIRAKFASRSSIDMPLKAFSSRVN